MVFNSAVFLFFFFWVFIAYWSLGRLSRGVIWQNRFLLLVSYVFYGYWDWVFLGLIFISTGIDYSVGRSLEKTESLKKRRILLSISIAANLGLLGAFKYFDFFASSFVLMARSVFPGSFPDGADSLLLKVILPVGISFYTFQTLSYTIDVYRRLIPAERNLPDFALFVCFFPQLVAGPIERAKDLLPQFKERRVFHPDDLSKGAWLMLLGFFMKVYVADNLDPLVNMVYLDGRATYEKFPQLAAGPGGFHVFLASIGFAFQIYGDFAGYSCIALGTARMMGIRLSVNFNAPELSQNPVEFWRRWHITLNRWLQDYVYIPLGGSRMGRLAKERNIFLAFMLVGLWHGANWTFVLWGVFHGVWLILYDLTVDRLPRLKEDARPFLRRMAVVLKMLGVFTVFGLTAVFFRAYDLKHSLILLKSLFTFPWPWEASASLNQLPAAGSYFSAIFNKIFVLLLLDIAAYRYKNYFWIFDRPLFVRVAVYTLLFLSILVMGVFGKDVIYFAF